MEDRHEVMARVKYETKMSKRPRGVHTKAGLCHPLPKRRIPSVSSMGPGAMEFTLMPFGPHSRARCRVMASAETHRVRVPTGRSGANPRRNEGQDTHRNVQECSTKEGNEVHVERKGGGE